MKIKMYKIIFRWNLKVFNLYSRTYFFLSKINDFSFKKFNKGSLFIYFHINLNLLTLKHKDFI